MNRTFQKLSRIAKAVLLSWMLFALTGCEDPEELEDMPAVLEATPIPQGTPAADPAQTVDIPQNPADPSEPEGSYVWFGANAAIARREVKNGQIQSFLTGEWKDTAVALRRPMAVMLSNNKPSLPQYGLSYASVIVEAPMESGSCTRLMAIIEDYDELDHLGPLRSSRLYFLLEAQSFDAIYCNWGLAVPYVAETINNERIDNISANVTGIADPSDEAFARDEGRKAAGYSTEYTGIMTISGYEAAVRRQGYQSEYHDTFEQNFRFVQDGFQVSYENAPDVTQIYPGGTESSGSGKASGYGHTIPYFVYEEDGLYHRYQLGAPHIDEKTGQGLTVSNVICKLVDGFKLDDNGYLHLEVRGEGDAVVFTGGKAVKCTWKREPDTEGIPNINTHATYYYDEEGNEIVLNKGKTWICLIWRDYETLLAYF